MEIGSVNTLTTTNNEKVCRCAVRVACNHYDCYHQIWLWISMRMENRGWKLPAIAIPLAIAGNLPPSDAPSDWEFWTRVGEGFHACSESWVYVASKAHQKFQ